MACFWTDLVGVRENCSGGGPTPGGVHVNAIIDIQSIDYGNRCPVAEWAWEDGNQLLNLSDAPPATTGTWINYVTASAFLGRLRNTIVPGGVDLPLEDLILNPANGRITTDGTLTVPALNTSGGSGPYTDSGLAAQFYNNTEFGLFYDEMYESLPSQYKYPLWATLCPWIPKRRQSTAARTQINMTVGMNSSVTELIAYLSPAGTSQIYSGDPPDSLNFNLTTTNANRSYSDFPPWEDGNLLSDIRNGINFSLNMRPMGAVSNITLDGWMKPELYIGEPGVIGAYVSNLALHRAGSIEELDSYGYDMPEVDVEPVPDKRIPIYWDEVNEYFTTGRTTAQAQQDSWLEDFPIFDYAYLSGELRLASDDSLVCRVAFKMYQSF